MADSGFEQDAAARRPGRVAYGDRAKMLSVMSVSLRR
jgi:hypothetical protein